MLPSKVCPCSFSDHSALKHVIAVLISFGRHNLHFAVPTREDLLEDLLRHSPVDTEESAIEFTGPEFLDVWFAFTRGRRQVPVVLELTSEVSQSRLRVFRDISYTRSPRMVLCSPSIPFACEETCNPFTGKPLVFSPYYDTSAQYFFDRVISDVFLAGLNQFRVLLS